MGNNVIMLLGTKKSPLMFATNPQICSSPMNIWNGSSLEATSAKMSLSSVLVELNNFEISTVLSSLSETNKEVRKFLKETQMARQCNYL